MLDACRCLLNILYELLNKGNYWVYFWRRIRAEFLRTVTEWHRGPEEYTRFRNYHQFNMARGWDGNCDRRWDWKLEGWLVILKIGSGTKGTSLFKLPLDRQGQHGFSTEFCGRQQSTEGAEGILDILWVGPTRTVLIKPDGITALFYF